MADELELVSDNAAADGWVDNSPGAVGTGYQSQNTAIQALFNGFDNSAISLNGLNADFAISGIIDDSGLPFVIKTAFSLVLPTTGDNHFLKIVAGSTPILKEIEFTTARGTFDASKNAFYSGTGERVLNWIYNVPSGELLKISGSKATLDLKLGSNIETVTGSDQSLAVLGTWYKYTGWSSVTDKLTEFASNTYTAKEDGVKIIIALARFTFTGSPGTQHGIAIYKNGSLYVKNEKSYLPTNTIPHTIEISAEINMIATDTIEIWVMGDAGAGGNPNPVRGMLLNINQNKDLF